MIGRHWIQRVSLLFFAVVLIGVAQATAVETTLYGSTVVVRDKGKPEVVSESFTVPNTQGEFTLVVQNGDADSASDRVTSGIIDIIGDTIFRPDDFNKQVDCAEQPIVLVADNTIAIELRGKPGSYVNISILARSPNRKNVITLSRE